MYITKTVLHDVILITNVTTPYSYYILSLRDSRGNITNYNCGSKGSNTRYTKIQVKLSDINSIKKGEYAYKIVMGENALDTSIDGKEILETGIIKIV